MPTLALPHIFDDAVCLRGRAEPGAVVRPEEPLRAEPEGVCVDGPFVDLSRAAHVGDVLDAEVDEGDEGEGGHDNVRTLHSVVVEEGGGLDVGVLTVHVLGRSFTRGLVRGIVGFMVRHDNPLAQHLLHTRRPLQTDVPALPWPLGQVFCFPGC